MNISLKKAKDIKQVLLPSPLKSHTMKWMSKCFSSAALLNVLCSPSSSMGRSKCILQVGHNSSWVHQEHRTAAIETGNPKCGVIEAPCLVCAFVHVAGACAGVSLLDSSSFFLLFSSFLVFFSSFSISFTISWNLGLRGSSA